MELLAPRELLAQPLLLGTLQGFHRQLVFAGQFQHHIGEAAALQLHQELDGVATGAAGEAVIELLSRRHRHRRRCVVVEGADPHELPPLLLEHHVLSHHIHDVGTLLDGLDRSGVETGAGQGRQGLGVGVRRTGGRSRERGRELGGWRPLEWVMVVRQEETVLVKSIGREGASAGGSCSGGSCSGGSSQRSWVGGVARGRSGNRQLPKLASHA